MFRPGCNEFEKHFDLLVVGALRANQIFDAQFVKFANHRRFPCFGVTLLPPSVWARTAKR